METKLHDPLLILFNSPLHIRYKDAFHMKSIALILFPSFKFCRFFNLSRICLSLDTVISCADCFDRFSETFFSLFLSSSRCLLFFECLCRWLRFFSFRLCFCLDLLFSSLSEDSLKFLTVPSSLPPTSFFLCLLHCESSQRIFLPECFSS